MCYYRTHEDGTLVNWNLHPNNVEMLYMMKVHRDSLEVHAQLDEFITEAEVALFEEHGRYFKAWLNSVSPERRNSFLNMEELQTNGRHDYESDVKVQILALLRDFMSV